MKRSIGWIALGGFVVSLVVHTAAILGTDVQERFPFIWILHVGMFIVFVPMVLAVRKQPGRGNIMALLGTFSPWAGVIAPLLFAYVIVNFGIFMVGSADGTPALREGKYVLHHKGEVIREISATEYHERNAAVLRGFSGHWLLFYFVPFVFFAARREAGNPAASAQDSYRRELQD